MMIESERLILRSWKDKDINDIVEGLNNINVAKWMAGVPFPYTKNDAKSFIKRAQNSDESVKISLAIVLKENNKVIGGTFDVLELRRLENGYFTNNEKSKKCKKN